ncbi:TPA: hypothetical protein ACNTG5_004832, partial [Escherichia coli]
MSYFCSKDIFKKGTSKEIHQMITGKLPPIDGAYIWHGRGLNLSLLRNDVSSTPKRSAIRR